MISENSIEKVITEILNELNISSEKERKNIIDDLMNDPFIKKLTSTTSEKNLNEVLVKEKILTFRKLITNFNRHESIPVCYIAHEHVLNSYMPDSELVKKNYDKNNSFSFAKFFKSTKEKASSIYTEMYSKNRLSSDSDTEAFERTLFNCITLCDLALSNFYKHFTDQEREKIIKKNKESKLQDDILKSFKESLKGISPEEAKKIIKELENNIG